MIQDTRDNDLYAIKITYIIMLFINESVLSLKEKNTKQIAHKY